MTKANATLSNHGGQTVSGHGVLPVARGHFSSQAADEWSVGSYFAHLGWGSLSLVKGMGLTMGYFVRPSRIITQQYPENRETLTMFPRFRGRLTMVFDQESGDTLCTACGICEKACPNGTISVFSCRDRAGRKVIGRYLYRLSQCTLCGLCVESCPFGALRMAQDFEMATYERSALELVLYGEEAS